MAKANELKEIPDLVAISQSFWEVSFFECNASFKAQVSKHVITSLFRDLISNLCDNIWTSPEPDFRPPFH